MIRCLIIRKLRNSRGQPVRREALITGENIQIGRAAECKVLLPDARVNLHHAMIRHDANGKLYIVGLEGEELHVNGTLQQHVECVVGTQVLLGAFLLTVEPLQPDCDLVLSIDTAEQTNSHVTAFPLTLTALGLSKRRPALWLAVVLVGMFLLFPVVQSLTTPHFKWSNYVPVSFLEAWSPGVMSHSHRAFAADCHSCHQTPFAAVSNQACENCHVTPRHLQNHALNDSAFKKMRCVACHPDHRGEVGLVRLDQQCVACHADIKRKNSNSKLVNIHDFSVDHPAFSLALKTGKQATDVRHEVQQINKPIQESSGLKFSHQVHLAKEGISSPEGDIVLSCPDCHQEDEAGVRFQPISMEKSCQQSGCHALDFNPPVSDRPLPHGSVDKLKITLDEYYAKTAITQMLENSSQQCGNAATIGANLLAQAQSCADNQVALNVQALFKPKSGCGECHEILPNPEDLSVPWKIKPVNITHHWLRRAYFPHSKHSTAKCSDCHDKTQSTNSRDIAIPNIANCRQCHTGARVVKGKVSSSCESCHIFHNEENHRTSASNATAK